METLMEMDPKQKLYVVTRSDLSAGAQAVQSGHALISFGFRFRYELERWHALSNYLCYLAVDDEAALENLCDEADKYGIKYSVFHEPDFDGALTAVCFEPTVKATKLMSGLSLALREFNERSDNHGHSPGNRSGNGSSSRYSEALSTKG